MLKRISYIVVVIIILCTMGNVSAASVNYVLDGKQRVPVPLTYRVKNVIWETGDKLKTMNQPEDIFIDRNDNLFVVDSGNNRVVKLDSSGKVSGIFSGPGDNALKNPMGIYVDDGEEMYIADTGNKRIIHLSSSGNFVEEFVKPESSLLTDSFTFDPLKLYINATGYIYVLKSHSFMTIDANNQFRGYVGATRVGYDFKQVLIRLFASREQKDRLAKKLPDSYSNFVIDKDGAIYATCSTGQQNQIVKLNSVGINIFKKASYGETADDGKPIKPTFVDIAVDEKGIVCALEQQSGKIYQYDQEGNLLTVFGGKGQWRGVFQMPSSLSIDSKGNIYVLDRVLNNIQVFEPTKFINSVHKAVGYYYDGEYSKAYTAWEDVLELDKNYKLAHIGIAKVLMKEEKWKEAINEYREADDKAGYSNAFNEYRKMIIREYFGLVVLVTVAGIILLAVLIKKIRFVVNDAIENGGSH